MSWSSAPSTDNAIGGVVVGSDIYGYLLSVQRDNNLVTNPIPETISESSVAAFSDPGRPPRFTTTRFAKPAPAEPALTAPVLTEARMNDLVVIAKKTEIAYCKVKPGYYSGSCNSVWLDADKPQVQATPLANRDASYAK